MLTAQENEHRRRLFIDPASNSTGYAFFVGATLVQSGNIVVDNKKKPTRPDADKLRDLFEEYHELSIALAPDEVHIEQLNYGTHFKCIWSVGAIMAAFGNGPVVQQDISPGSWKKHAQWDGHDTTAGPYQGLLEDERAARCMGDYYLSTLNLEE